jgi:UDP-N-acetyl-2-amino-2-deoxyglucuronate dehydrogenase
MPVVHALIGCGRVAPNHLDGFRACQLSELRWACDRDPKVLEAFVGDHDVRCYTPDYREVLADSEVDSVSITVDHAQHARLTREALLAGKHVLVEKPLSLSLEEGLELVRLAEERHLILAVVSQHRYDPLVKQVKHMLDRGVLGPLVSIWANLQCRREPGYYSGSYWRGTWDGEGGSVLINQAYHYIDLMRWMGGPILQVSAMMNTIKLSEVIETEDTFCGLLYFANGALGSLSATTASEVFWRSRIDVIGTQGSLHFDIDHPDTLHFHQLSPAAEQILLPFLKSQKASYDLPPGKDYYGISHRHQIDEFVHAVAKGDQVTVNGFEALQTLDLVLKLYQSARKGYSLPM